VSELRDAVAEDRDAFSPERIPPFQAVLARKRRQDRRSLANRTATGAVVVASVFAVAAGLNGGDDRLAPTADARPDAPVRYELLFADAAALDAHDDDLGACTALPGAVEQKLRGGSPLVRAVTVTGRAENEEFLRCARAVEGVAVRVQPPMRWVPGVWAVEEYGPDRASVTVRAYGPAGSCTGPGRGSASETAEGIAVAVEVAVPTDDSPCGLSLPMPQVTIELPRPLQDGEAVSGECSPDLATDIGRQCERVRAFVAQGPPDGE
jgi:hypothetical protein